jgi:hypothetical protein
LTVLATLEKHQWMQPYWAVMVLLIVVPSDAAIAFKMQFAPAFQDVAVNEFRAVQSLKGALMAEAELADASQPLELGRFERAVDEHERRHDPCASDSTCVGPDSEPLGCHRVKIGASTEVIPGCVQMLSNNLSLLVTPSGHARTKFGGCHSELENRSRGQIGSDLVFTHP